MTYVLEKAKLDTASHRRIAALSAYDFRIKKYRPGKVNADADALSRMPHLNDDGFCEINPNCVQALCQSHHCCYVTYLAISATPSDGMDLHGEIIPKGWRRLQYADPMLKMFAQAVGKSRKPLLSDISVPRGHILLHQSRRLVLK